MGSFSDQERSRRFIEEFNADAVKDYGPVGPFIGQVTAGLGYCDHDHTVRMFWRTDAVELLVYDAPMFFDPNNPDHYTVALVCETLQMEEDEAIKRLKKAKLISKEG